ncbi:oligosaccharide flippase family protein [Sphingomonas sp. ID1715]|uniref:oligosaccharide flippase family protein n=1 Tax=Sphingomonas sp. ID1715 TaxID=1656898 RepID=UPI00148948B9|nr:oligosaccharide flippase family protein [Sphingomonas sp. ID1715]NNM78600.1 oligosaccharide flippase family protein [Sphingomonas sp. ID1715]
MDRHWAGAKSYFATFLRQGVVRSIAVLVGGTVAAHTITALSMPISTRLFTPADFSVAAAFSSLVGIFSAAACLRFDMAIPLPEDETEAADLLVLSVLTALAVAVVLGVTIALLPQSVFSLLKQPALEGWLWLLPVGVTIGGTYLALQMWFVRHKSFAGIASSRIAQSTSAAVGQISLGLAGYAPLGLIVGQLFNYGAGSAWLGCAVLIKNRVSLRSVSLRGIAQAVSKYRRFPLFSTWEALANAASIHAPMLLIAALTDTPEAGYLTLAIFLLQMPMALVGNAVGQIYISQAPERFREGQLADYTSVTITHLARLSAGPLMLIAVLSPRIFGLVFGPGWDRAGTLAAWMAPWFFMQLLAVPVSTALHIVGRQQAAMVLQIGGLVLRLAAVALSLLVAMDIVAEAYAVSGFVFYAVYLFVVGRSTGMRSAEVIGSIARSIPFALLGGLMAWGLLLVASQVFDV